MRLIIFLLVASSHLVAAQSGLLSSEGPVIVTEPKGQFILGTALPMRQKCIDVSVKPIVYGKLDTTYSYVKQIVLQHWPYAWQMPDSSEYNWDGLYCKQKIEVEIQEPYWKKPKQYTFKEFKKLIYGQ